MSSGEQCCAIGVDLWRGKEKKKSRKKKVKKKKKVVLRSQQSSAYVVKSFALDWLQ